MSELQKKADHEMIGTYPVKVEEVYPLPVKPYIKVTLYFPFPEYTHSSQVFIRDRIRIHEHDGIKSTVLVLEEEPIK